MDFIWCQLHIIVEFVGLNEEAPNQVTEKQRNSGAGSRARSTCAGDAASICQQDEFENGSHP
jgi:hypothetical protein